MYQHVLYSIQRCVSIIAICMFALNICRFFEQEVGVSRERTILCFLHVLYLAVTISFACPLGNGIWTHSCPKAECNHKNATQAGDTWTWAFVLMLLCSAAPWLLWYVTSARWEVRQVFSPKPVLMCGTVKTTIHRRCPSQPVSHNSNQVWVMSLTQGGPSCGVPLGTYLALNRWVVFTSGKRWTMFMCGREPRTRAVKITAVPAPLEA